MRPFRVKVGIPTSSVVAICGEIDDIENMTGFLRAWLEDQAKAGLPSEFYDDLWVKKYEPKRLTKNEGKAYYFRISKKMTPVLFSILKDKDNRSGYVRTLIRYLTRDEKISSSDKGEAEQAPNVENLLSDVLNFGDPTS